jgi:hypothetical protein
VLDAVAAATNASNMRAAVASLPAEMLAPWSPVLPAPEQVAAARAAAAAAAAGAAGAAAGGAFFGGAAAAGSADAGASGAAPTAAAAAAALATPAPWETAGTAGVSGPAADPSLTDAEECLLAARRALEAAEAEYIADQGFTPAGAAAIVAGRLSAAAGAERHTDFTPPPSVFALPRAVGSVSGAPGGVPLAGTLDAPSVRRSRTRQAASQRWFAACEAKLAAGRGPVFAKGSKTPITDVASLRKSQTEPPAYADCLEENAFVVTEGKNLRPHPTAPEGLAPYDALLGTKDPKLGAAFRKGLWALLTGSTDTPAQHYPSPDGPNPGALSTLAVHICYGDAETSEMLLKAVARPLDSYDIDTARPALALCEALCAVPDNMALARRSRVWAMLWSQWRQSVREGFTEMAFELLHAILRLSILIPLGIGDALLGGDGSALAQVEHTLRAVEGDPKRGAGKASLWLAAAIDAEGRPEVAAAIAAAPAPAAGASASAAAPSALQRALDKHISGMGEKEGAALPLRRYIASRIAHPRSALDLTFRDETGILAALDMTYSLRATLLLQRLARIAGAHGRRLFGPAEAQRLAEAADKVEAEAAAAAEATAAAQQAAQAAGAGGHQ